MKQIKLHKHRAPCVCVRERCTIWHASVVPLLALLEEPLQRSLACNGHLCVVGNTTRKPVILLPFLYYDDQQIIYLVSHGREKKNIPCLILDSNSSPSFGRRGPGRPSPPPSPAAIFMRSSACAMVVHGSRAPQDIRNYVLSFQKEIGSSDSVVHRT